MRFIMGIGKWFRKEMILFFSLFLLFILSIYFPSEIKNYLSFVDWNTIVAFTGLLFITNALKESNYFNFFARSILLHLKTERSLAFLFIFLSAFLSTFLTNDIALFIVVPITLSIKNAVKTDISKLIIFEAIAVNVGSALTPIGNPQNIFLWHRWNISFFLFIYRMFPLIIFLLIFLFVFVWLIFNSKKIEFIENPNRHIPLKKTLFVFSMIVLIIYIIFLEVGYGKYILLPFIIIFLIIERKILKTVDWVLVLFFIVVFIDFHLISIIPMVFKTVNQFNLHTFSSVYLFSALISQLFSNVPAAVFVSKFSQIYPAIAYGVNVGGNGLVIASLANIIALRMVKEKGVWMKFHKYSIPYFLFSGGIVYIFFYLTR